jgi:hypothetical protein
MALMDAFLPGVGNWREVWLLRDKHGHDRLGTTSVACHFMLIWKIGGISCATDFLLRSQ